MKIKKLAVLLMVVATCAFVLAMAGCSTSATSSNDVPSDAASVIQEGTLLARHSNGELDGITEVSYENCLSCHGGDYEGFIEETDGYWEEFCNIKAANPHASHGTVAFQCQDCHKLSGESVVQCNGCHIFELPEGWVGKDPRTASEGLIAEVVANPDFIPAVDSDKGEVAE